MEKIHKWSKCITQFCVVMKTVVMSLGSCDGFGVQRGKNAQNGSTATQITLHVFYHHCGPNEKGKNAPCCLS